ncbi:MAG: hypothetical protein KAS75_04080 [Planctomycetes bacterium]|nr:hypothetical protein [Planctomycetota bacterium]
MTETKKTLQLLNTRYQEVALIIGLNVLAAIATKIVHTPEQRSIAPLAVLLLIFTVATAIISTILNYGFQRTTFLEGKKHQQPLVLLKTGSRFFWRMVKFGILLVPAYIILVWLTFLATKQFLPSDITFDEIRTQFPFAYQLCFAIPTIILIKPLTLMPAIIIVFNCRVLESWHTLKYCKLAQARELVTGFCIMATLGFLWTSLPEESQTSAKYVMAVIPTFVNQLASLTVAILAIRFVASLNLVYDDQQDSPDTHDLLKDSLEN